MRPEPGKPGRAEQVVWGRESRLHGEGGQVGDDMNRGSAKGAGFRTFGSVAAGEPDAVKAARPVRRGADGKGPANAGTSPAAYPTAYALEEAPTA